MNNNDSTTIRNRQIAYLIFVMIYLTGCTAGPQISTGDVINLYSGTASWIVDGCLRGECATHIYTKGNLVVFARPFIDNVAFVVTSKGVPVDKLNGLSGNLVNCSTWADFQAWMLSNGFTVVSTLGPMFKTALSVGASIASMELVPIFGIILTPSELPEWVAGEVSNE